MRLRKKSYKPSRQSGVGLVEIMVALAIGLATTLIVMQVMTAYDKQRRTASGGADAETNSSIALHIIQRQAQLAGYGLPLFLNDDNPMKCQQVLSDDDANPGTPDAPKDIAPIKIVDGGTAPGASDTVIVRFGSAPTGAAPVNITDVPPSPLVPPVTVTVEHNFGCEKNTTVMIFPKIYNGTCYLDMIKEIPKNSSGAYERDKITLKSGVHAGALGSKISCMGNWNEVAYSVSNGNLLGSDGAVIMANVVNLQAQYGISAMANSSTVSQWVDATGAWANPSPSDRSRIKAIRVAVVARSEQMELTNISSACSSLTSDAPTGVCAWAGTETDPAPKIDLSNDPNWQRYRYRVQETIIPLRNIIWAAGEGRL